MRRPLVAGNWKMNGTCASVATLLDGLSQQALPESVDVAVFPAFIHIAQVIERVGAGVRVGAQTCADQVEQGAYTGEVACSQLADIGCRMVLIGHSERRALLDETEERVIRKFAAAQQAGLIPVLCLGETLEQREAGRTLEVVGGQLASVVDALGIQAFADAVIAYEPVWAIGTGLTASPEQAQEVHQAIRQQLAEQDADVACATRILYGGSVKASSAAELFGMPDIDGGLVGGASLNAEEFGAICRAAGY